MDVFVTIVQIGNLKISKYFSNSLVLESLSWIVDAMD